MHKSESYPNKVSPHCSAYTVGLNTNKNSSMKLEMDVYGRQNSVNEIKENDLSTQPGKLKVPDYSRQPSECRLINDTVKVVIKGDDFQSTSTISSTESDLKNEKRRDKGNTCCYLLQAFTFLVTILTLGLVLYLFYKTNQSQVHHVPTVIMESKQVYEEETDDVSGSFKLDQNFLSEKKSVRWMADANSRIVPSENEPCLLIPEDGKYLVFSRFTFRIPPGENETILTHQLAIKSVNEAGEKVKKVLKRQYVSIVEHQIKNDSEMRKPSVFIQSFELSAGNEVCTWVSSPELLYISPIDNDVTIIKV